MSRRVQVAVVGASGSGKTWLAQRLCAELQPGAAHLKLDDFYRDLSRLKPEERALVNFDNPDAIDWDRVRSVIEALARGNSAEVPAYDFATHTRKPAPRRQPATEYVIWDGLWLLHEDWLREKFAFSVLVDCAMEEPLARRIARDVLERGRTPESVRRQFVEQVEPLRQRFVEPQRRWVACCLPSPVTEAAVSALLTQIRAAARGSP